MDDSNLKQARLEKLEKLKARGINPYPASYEKKDTIADCLKNEGKTIKTAGKIFSFREHGNIAFADLKDETGKIQIFFQKKLLGDAFKNLKLLDIGDYIGIEGTVGKTIAGEISILPTIVTLLTKSLQSLPSEWFGLKDTEIRYRKRYLDLLLNDESKQRFLLRSKIITSIREYMDENNVLEVETPTLQPLYGGANARPFITHHNALDSDFYLKISDELYLKRLVAGGLERVYEIDHDFRNEGVDKSHNPEFTMFETYWSYANYETMMKVTEGLYEFVAKKVLGKTIISYQGTEINLQVPWRRLTMKNAIKEYLQYDVDMMSERKLIEAIGKFEKDYSGKDTAKGILIAKLFEFTEEFLIQPTFITDFPKETTALCKPKPNDPDIIERFEPYINGWEIGNAYSELNDPLLQRQYFEDQLKTHKDNKEEAQPVDEDFIESMEYGMPPMGGLGLGLDRMIMLFTDAKNIKDVIFFPTLRPTMSIHKVSTKAFDHPEVFSIDKDVKEKFPSVSIGVARIAGVFIKEIDEKLEKEKETVLQSLENLTTEQINESPEIQSYRKLYKVTGIDWHSRRPSPEALLRRVTLKKGLYTINTAVDAYNLVVLKHHVSAGAFDADAISFPTKLQFAKETDTISLLGDREPTIFKNGEVAYFDQKGPFNIDFNYRDAQRTAVTTQTKNLYINVDGIFDISAEKVHEVLKEVCAMITKYCGGTVEFMGVVTESVANISLTEKIVSQKVAKPISVTDNINFSREQAFSLLKKYMENKNLIKHCLAAEAAMKGIYKYLHEKDYRLEQEVMWGITGLLHDIDYEIAQKENKLDKHGILLFDRIPDLVPEPMMHAIKAHNYTMTGVDPESDLDWAITCVDQLTGLVVSSALIHPEKKLWAIDGTFVLKRFNTPGFSKGVDRNTIKMCEEKLRIPLEKFIEITLTSMQAIANEMGL